MPTDSTDRHPGYPRAIGDIIANGSSEERAALKAWLRGKFSFVALRDVPECLDQSASQLSMGPAETVNRLAAVS